MQQNQTNKPQKLNLDVSKKYLPADSSFYLLNHEINHPDYLGKSVPMAANVEEGRREYQRLWAKNNRIKNPHVIEKQRQRSSVYYRDTVKNGLPLRQKQDLIGVRFGQLVVTGKSELKKNRDNLWVCDCDCGAKDILKSGGKLNSGWTKSCGCLRKTFKVTHGESKKGKDAEYRVWAGMKSRCLNVNNSRHDDYGGRGIGICYRWLKYENFLEDMGRRPSKFHTIERINNDGQYEPSNCIWALPKIQSRNKRNTVKITYQGKVLSLREWAEKLKIKPEYLYNNMRYKKLTIEEVVAKYAAFAK